MTSPLPEIDPCIPSPCFVLDRRCLRRNLACIGEIREATGVEILLALKGFAMARVFPDIAAVATGATASSLNEARHASRTFAGHLHAYAPVYIDAEFDEIARLSSHVTFNSVNQLERFRRRAGGCSLGLRVNPEYSEVATDLYNPCVPGSRLGVRAEALGAGLPPGVEGLHVHNLCECGAEASAATIANLERLFGRFLDHLKWLNLGGGHLMTRPGYRGDILVEALRDLRSRHANLQIILEPGAAFVWQTGVLLATIVDIVENCGVRTAMLDVSFACHMPDCLEMPYTPEVRGAEIVAPGDQGWRLGGCSCLAGDFVGAYRFADEPRIGQRLLFEDMMHYTMVKTTSFNGVNLPAIGLVDDQETFELVRAFGYPDYASRLA